MSPQLFFLIFTGELGRLARSTTSKKKKKSEDL
jgi:hypothetical protein